MKAGRRSESDSLRRDARDRDLGRFNRKRPSMLSEFHVKQHTHRDTDRESDGSHFRYSRHTHDNSPGPPSDHSNRFMFPSPGLHKLKTDPRVRRPYSPLASHHSNYRTHHHGQNRMDSSSQSNENVTDQELPAKRPCLSVDTGTLRKSNDTPNMSSADSVGSVTIAGANHRGASPSPVSKSGGLSAYHLEDIDSDDDDSLMKDEEPQSTGKVPQKEGKPPEKEGMGSGKPGKDELLQMMEKVDRDISTVETQISTLQKKQAELEERGQPTPATPSPKTPSPDISSPSPEATPTNHSPLERHTVVKMSLVESVYNENKSKAHSTAGLLAGLSGHTKHWNVPLYFQPSEAPCYHANIASHKRFRPLLIEFLRQQKLSRHQKELSLCQRYDSLMTDWEKRVERVDSPAKKKARDLKNRELFEKTFPELKTRREQQERFTRVDGRGFGVVRSDAELNELMYELSSKESAAARYRRTHAVIPPMVLGEGPRFYSNNGHLEDAMALHRELKFTNIWTEEEKAIFRDKFILYPKNFEVIAKFLPNKSPGDCVKFYYLSKKSENFKQLVRKANLKRKKPLIKPPELSLSASLPTTHLSSPSLLPKMEPHPSVEELGKTKSEYGDWTDANISALKEGLRKFGRAWGKVYREVGGSKTATQCKMFYDDFHTEQGLGLQEALLEHSRMKNAEKQRRKSQSRKPAPEPKKKVVRQPSPPPASEGDSENTESATESDSNEDGSVSESTITDSEEIATNKPTPSNKRQRPSRKVAQSLTSTPVSAKTSEDVVDLFLTAAEALKNNISPDVALHDHTYSLPPTQMSVDLQGSSGLSLIAAAAAVVSPSLSRSAGSGKHAVVSPVRAPRGRPPNKYRGGSNYSTIKLSPTLLSPAGGASANVLLSDIKTTAFRNRTRSAPTDRPKSSTIHIPRSGSTLARMSLSGGSAGRGKVSSGYNKQRSDSPSLKSMIALQPTTQQSGGGTAAFEALVNVAVAAPPAELPKSSTTSTGQIIAASRTNTVKKSSVSRGSTSTPSPVNTLSGKLTLSRTNSNDSNNSAGLTNGPATATAYIDVSQAINILASLAQQSPGSSAGASHTISVYPGQPLIAQSGVASTIIGGIMSQGASKKSTNSTSSGVPVSSNPASVSATVDTLLSHLTSGVSKAGHTRNTPSPKPTNRVKKLVNKTEPVRASATQSNCPDSTQSSTNSDDLSNLKLLSSLVAAVAATQSSPSVTTAPVDVSTHSTASGSPAHSTTATVSHSSSTELSRNREQTPDSTQPNTSSNCSSSADHHLSSLNSDSDDLPRGVVRPSLSPYSSVPRAPTTSDMTASLASIIPSYNPSVGQQSTLLLYTRSRSFPQTVDPVPEEEDTLESATRGISELSKLLGTDSNGEPDSPLVSKKGHNVTSGYLNSADSAETATNGAPISSIARVMINDYPPQGPADSPSSMKLNLSSLLESRGTVHQTSVSGATGNHGNSLGSDTHLTADTQSR